MNLGWLLREGKGVPVLMYHKVWPGTNDDLTITPERLREHWEYLKKEGYHTLSLPDYLLIATGRKQAPPKALLITFDDGYVNNRTYAYPLLKELGWQATFFIITGTLDGGYDTGEGPDRKMTPAELAQLDPATVQLALHGYGHEHMRDIHIEAAGEAVRRSVKVAGDSGLPFHMVFAYPYGARPEGSRHSTQLKELMKAAGIAAAFRIGNAVSKVPAPDIYEIKRIDIKGTDMLKELAIKLKKGKLKPF